MSKLSMQELIKKLNKFELENPEVNFRVQRSSTKGTLAVVHIYEDANEITIRDLIIKALKNRENRNKDWSVNWLYVDADIHLDNKELELGFTDDELFDELESFDTTTISALDLVPHYHMITAKSLHNHLGG